MARSAVSPAADLVGLGWRPRSVPREVVGLACVGGGRQALLAAVLAMDPSPRGALLVAAGPEVGLVLGPADVLPWVDGATWLGRDAQAPSLLLPTTHDPVWPLELLERRLLAARGVRTGAIAVLPREGLLVATGPAATPDVAALRVALGEGA